MNVKAFRKDMAPGTLPEPAARFEQLYRSLDAGSVSRMAEVYSPDVLFRDPVHELCGLPALQEYTAALVAGVQECRFACRDWVINGGDACVHWEMRLRHRALSGGRPVYVTGMSSLHFHERIDYHEDFYDLGAMVYEHVPLLGGMVRALKRRLGGR